MLTNVVKGWSLGTAVGSAVMLVAGLAFAQLVPAVMGVAGLTCSVPIVLASWGER